MLVAAIDASPRVDAAELGEGMAKSKRQAAAPRASARKTTGKTANAARRVTQPRAPQAMPRSMQKRGSGDSRQAVQQPPARTRDRRGKQPDEAVTRVTHETEVRGTETRIERVV